jgi:hypothetical protein
MRSWTAGAPGRVSNTDIETRHDKGAASKAKTGMCPAAQQLASFVAQHSMKGFGRSRNGEVFSIG